VDGIGQHESDDIVTHCRPRPCRIFDLPARFDLRYLRSISLKDQYRTMTASLAASQYLASGQ
jgi:hypothetical protein